MKYTLIFLQEQIWYSVSVLELPWCISEWDTKEEALYNIKESIILYLQWIADIAKIKVKKNANIIIDSLSLNYETV
jgi:predicted RNase H-like HicB family nuclease